MSKVVSSVLGIQLVMIGRVLWVALETGLCFLSDENGEEGFYHSKNGGVLMYP